MYDRIKNGRRGAALMLVIIMMFIVCLSIAWFLSYQKDLGKLGNRRREQMRAFYVADIGIQRIIHWFNYPEEYTPDTVLFTRFIETGSYFDELNQSRFTSIVTVPEFLLPTVYDADNSYLGELTHLRLLPPDPLTDPVSCIVKVESIGIARSGPPKTIVAYLNNIEGFDMGSGAAIISEEDGAWGGQFNTHWGEIWIKEDATLPNMAHVSRAFRNDQWLRLITESHIIMNNGNYADGTINGSVNPLPPSAPNYYQPWLTDMDLYKMYQHTDIDFPQYDYYLYKEFAILKGRYYGTDALGNVYRNGIIDEEHMVADIDAEIHSPDPENSPYEYIFIDTIDQQPPALDGSNMCTIRLCGSAGHSKGVLYIANNVYLGGSGDPPDVNNAIDPDDNTHVLEKVRHQGLFYASGEMSQQGENLIYGSCVAKGGFGAGGCPTVYYDYRLKDGNLFPFSSNVRIVLWNAL
jgi:hypothetical protein